MQPQDNPYQPNDQLQPGQSIQPQASTTQLPARDFTAAPASYAAPDLTTHQPPSVDMTGPSSHKGSFLRTASKVLAVLVVVGGLAGVGYGLNAKYSKDHATATAKSFISFLNVGDDTSAYKLTTSNLRSIQSETQFTSNMGDLTAKSPTLSKQSLHVDGKNAVYTATVNGLPKTDFGRTDGNFTIALVKHGLNSWQVDGAVVE